MKTKLEPHICYMAGLLSKSFGKSNEICIATSIDGIEKKFLDICVKRLKIDPSRIVIDERETHRRIYFYDSRLYKELKRIIEREDIIFKRRNEFSSSYVAGMFDAGGKVREGSLMIAGMTIKDQLTLENLGVHIRKDRIVSISSFITLIQGSSVLLERIHRPGDERDLH